MTKTYIGDEPLYPWFDNSDFRTEDFNSELSKIETATATNNNSPKLDFDWDNEGGNEEQATTPTEETPNNNGGNEEQETPTEETPTTETPNNNDTPNDTPTMKYIDLVTIKKHLNIDEEYTYDDGYLELLADATAAAVEKHIDTPLTDLEDENGDIPNPLKMSMLLLIGHYYNRREAVSNSNVQEVPLAYEYLLSLYKNYNGEITQ